MLLINFSHPLTPAQTAWLETRLGQPVEVRDVAVKLDLTEKSASIGAQAAALADQAGLSPAEWQTAGIYLVNLPAFSAAAGLVLAEIHGRAGHFPAALWMRPVKRDTFTDYEIGGIIDLNTQREEARERR